MQTRDGKLQTTTFALDLIGRETSRTTFEGTTTTTWDVGTGAKGRVSDTTRGA